MRRHTTLIEPNASLPIVSSSNSTTTLNSLNSDPAASASASTIRNNGEKGRNAATNGGGSSNLVGTSGSDAAATAGVDASAGSEARNGAGGAGAGAGAGVGQSGDPFERPESPPVQEETPKHHRFSMLRFRTASDSQLSARSRQHLQAEKPPPMPQRTYLPFFPVFHLAFPPYPRLHAGPHRGLHQGLHQGLPDTLIFFAKSRQVPSQCPIPVPSQCPIPVSHPAGSVQSQCPIPVHTYSGT